MKTPIRVLIIDDSALMRSLISELLGSAPDIRVVGAAPDPYVARQMIKQLAPDVLTLDVEMPHMDGLTFLENLMRLRPVPVVMLSSLTTHGADVTLRALELGAVDFIVKPRMDVVCGMHSAAAEIIAKVRAAAETRPRAIGIHALARSVSAPSNDQPGRSLIALGASTGGTEAIREILSALPPDAPPVVIAQHIPAAFSAAFANRLDRSTALHVAEARDGERLVAGRAYVAAGNRHLRIQHDGPGFRCQLNDGPEVNRQRPSVDVLFRSVASAAGDDCAAALLTGMGDDGARGLLALHEAGAQTIVQDEATSVVWGMPGAAHRLGAADAVLPLFEIAAQLMDSRQHPPRHFRTAAASRYLQ